jgi:hypothetical protein
MKRTTIWLSAVAVCAMVPCVAHAIQPKPADGLPAAPAVAAPVEATPTASSPDKTAAPVTATVKISNATPTFGDTIRLEVDLSYPSDYRVFFPTKPNLKPFATLPQDAGTSERVEQGGRIVEKYRIPLLVVRNGVLRTPAIEVPYHAVTASGGAGESGSVTLPPQRVVVRSQFAAETEVKPAALPDPRPLIEENTPLQVALLVLGMMAVAAVLTLVGVRMYKARVARLQPKPQIPPHVLALGRLEELQRSGRLASEAPRLVIGELSEILREYLGGRYRLLALDMTSTELLNALAYVDLRQVALDEMRRFADDSDLMKFAGLAASPDEIADMAAFVRSVVERTMQTAEELDRIRAAEIARLARQKRLRIQVMAPPSLRLRAFALDVMVGAVAVALVAWLAIDTGRQSLFDAAFVLGLVWLALRDSLGGGSPGKALVGLQIASFDDALPTRPQPATGLPPGLDDELESIVGTTRMASWTARLQRNLLMLLPGGGLVAEALTTLWLPEQRRLGDQWAGTRVIDGRHGLRSGKPSWLPAVLLLVVALVLVVAPWVLGGGRPV